MSFSLLASSLRRRSRAAVLCALALACWAVSAGGQTLLYVATNGNDGWSGTLAAPNGARTDGPLASLDGARIRLRALRQAAPLTNGATVYVRGGLYHLTNTFEVDAVDGGLSNAPILYTAYPNETPILNGGRQVTNFGPWRGSILQANLWAQGVTNPFHQLFFNGHRQTLARYPNSVEADPYHAGWSYLDGPLTNMYVDLPNDSRNTFRFKSGDVRFWARPQEVEVFVFPRYNWFNDILPIATVDTGQHLITLASNADFALRPGDRYFVRNVFEELDTPGEWYLDTLFGVLYFWPPCSAGSAVVTVPVVEAHLVILSAANVTLQGFTLEVCDDTAIGLHGATNCNVLGCTLRNASGYGVAVFGYGNSIIGNDIYSVGKDGIYLQGGVQTNLTSGANLAENNYIHHLGVFFKGASGIMTEGVGNAARHNWICYGPRAGILLQGNLSTAEYNRIEHVNLETDDTAGISTSGPDWISARGNLIRYNYIADSQGFGFDSGQYGTPDFAWGIYLDTDAATVDIVGNLVADCSRGGIYLHNGRDNLISNNVVVNNALEQLTYSGWTSTTSDWLSYLPGMIAAYDSVSNQPAWRALRGMNVSPTQAVLPDGLLMANNVFVKNIVAYTNAGANAYWLNLVPLYTNQWSNNVLYAYGAPVQVLTNQQPTSLAAWQAGGRDKGSLVADPLFVNLAAGDYHLQSNSPALALGFVPLPLEQIGLYASPWRASWPVLPELPGGELQLQVYGADVVVRLQSSVDHLYQLQSATSLSAGLWQNIGLPQDGNGAVLSFTNVAGAGAPARYYRFQTCP